MGRYILRTFDASGVAEHVCDAVDDIEARRFILTKFALEIVGAQVSEVHSEDGRLIWAK